MKTTDALVIGAGPSGLMAAEVLARRGHSVLVADAKPSMGRKFLMAGKSGLNLTKAEDAKTFVAAYDESAEWLGPMLADWGANEVQTWARDLGMDLFTGTTGRVFPRVMKASPLLRAWLARLAELGVTFETRWRWTGWNDQGVACFDTNAGVQLVNARATVLALGGASWKRLGSDGEWAGILREKGVELAGFQPSNAGITVAWSSYMERHFGQPLKNVAFSAGTLVSRGEAVISRTGLEGGGIYSISKAVREGHPLFVDLLPEMSVEQVAARLAPPAGKQSLATLLRKRLKLSGARLAILNEFARPLPRQIEQLAPLLKKLSITHTGMCPIDEAISTAGGIRRNALTTSLMLTALPGVFAVGEMLDWEAPTGGYLLTACFATGQRAGNGAADWLSKDQT